MDGPITAESIRVLLDLQMQAIDKASAALETAEREWLRADSDYEKAEAQEFAKALLGPDGSKYTEKDRHHQARLGSMPEKLKANEAKVKFNAARRLYWREEKAWESARSYSGSLKIEQEAEWKHAKHPVTP